jgi:hypothetical protein
MEARDGERIARVGHSDKTMLKTFAELHSRSIPDHGPRDEERERRHLHSSATDGSVQQFGPWCLRAIAARKRRAEAPCTENGAKIRRSATTRPG